MRTNLIEAADYPRYRLTSMRAELIIQGPDGEQRIPLSDVSFDGWSFAGRTFRPADPEPPMVWGSSPITNGSDCQCPLCRMGHGFPESPSDAEAEADLPTLLNGCAPYEVLMARDALRAGRMHGRDMRSCLIGQLAQACGLEYGAWKAQRALFDTQIEIWVTVSIARGMTPWNNAKAALLDRWLTAWLDARTLELPPMPALPSTLLESRAPLPALD